MAEYCCVDCEHAGCPQRARELIRYSLHATCLMPDTDGKSSALRNKLNEVIFFSPPFFCLVVLCSPDMFSSPSRLKRCVSPSGPRMEVSGAMERMGPTWTVGSCRPWPRRMRRSTSTTRRLLEWVCRCLTAHPLPSFDGCSCSPACRPQCVFYSVKMKIVERTLKF